MLGAAAVSTTRACAIPANLTACSAGYSPATPPPRCAIWAIANSSRVDSLPQPLAEGRGLFKEGRVHRWINTISGLPGGWDVQELRDRHMLAPESDPGL